MTRWPTWGDPPSPPPPVQLAPPQAGRRRWALVAGLLPVVAGVVHVAPLATTSPPMPRLVALPLPSLAAARTTSDAPPAIEAARPSAATDALLRTYDAVAVNVARPSVILAWSRTEVALTGDDGTSWTRWPLPPSDGGELPVGTVTGDGVGLLSLGLQGWMRIRPGGVESVRPPVSGVVSVWASDETWTFGVVTEPDRERTLFSVDHGVTWSSGPDAPQGTYAIRLLPGRRVAAAYQWSASCGGGGEGVMALRPGDADWSTIEQGNVGHLKPDLHVVTTECDGALGAALCVWPPGADARPALGPPLARHAGSTTWFASGRAATFAGGDGHVLRVEGGVFRSVDTAAPSSLSGVVVDGRDRLVGIANGHVVQWTPAADGAAAPDGGSGWRVHLP